MRKLFLALSAAALVVGCGSNETSSENPTVTTTEATAVQTVTTKCCKASLMNIALTEQFTSEIKPYKQNIVLPTAQGVKITSISVEVGDKVKEGDLLVTLDPTMFKRQKIQLEQLESDYKRLLPVYKAGGISGQEIDQIKNQLNIQRETIKDMERNINVISPITGVITERNYESGDLFAGQPILKIMQINKLKVLVNVSEQYFSLVKTGMNVEVGVNIFPNETFKGKVSLIHPALDASTRTFAVEVTMDNKADKLRPGMFARTTFNMGNEAQIVVDDIAVLKQVGSDENYVYVVKDGVAERRSVKTGRKVGSKIAILSGVTEGEEVAITAFSRISDGTRVTVK